MRGASRGTDGSNPASSSGESTTNQSSPAEAEIVWLLQIPVLLIGATILAMLFRPRA
jgi:hypothetical protein